MPEASRWPVAPCIRCGEPVIPALSTRGDPWEMDPARTDDGAWTLTGTGTQKPTARKPSKRLSFGVKYYQRHTCQRATFGGAR